jgi:hypothetical protein
MAAAETSRRIQRQYSKYWTEKGPASCSTCERREEETTATACEEESNPRYSSCRVCSSNTSICKHSTGTISPACACSTACSYPTSGSTGITSSTPAIALRSFYTSSSDPASSATSSTCTRCSSKSGCTTSPSIAYYTLRTRCTCRTPATATSSRTSTSSSARRT